MSPAMTLSSAPPSGLASRTDSRARRSWYRGSAHFRARGWFTHSCRPWKSPPDTTSASGGFSMCRTPPPAVIHWVSPLLIVPPPPWESACSKVPSMMYVTVSKPRCGCQDVPLGSPGAYSTSPIWSMWMNGSRSRRSTPAKARRTGKPSPSKPDGAVVTERTRRRTVPGAGTGTRGRVVVSSTVTAGMPASSVESSTSADSSAARPRCLPSTADDFDPSAGMPRRRGRPSPAASGGTFLTGPEGEPPRSSSCRAEAGRECGARAPGGVAVTFLKRCRRTLWAVAMATVLAVSLAGAAGIAPLWTEVAGLPGPGDSPIRHVVVIYQENHSFDNVLGYQCAQWTKQRQQGQTPAHQPCDGFDPSQPIRGLTDPATGGPVYAHRATDVVENAGHSTEAQAQALANDWLGISDCAPGEGEHCLNYFTPDQIPSFAALAQQYAVSDRTFYASAVPSFGAHLEFAAATLDGFTGDNPRKGPGTANKGWGCSSMRIAPWRPTPQSPIEYVRACIPDERGALYGGGTTPVPYVPTYMTRMDAAGVSYRMYGPGHSPTTLPDQAIDYCDYFTESSTTAQRESDVNINSFLTDVSTNSLP